jgi:uncharacterized protein (TIGR00251 family)
MESDFYSWTTDDTLILRVYLQPAASHNKVVGIHNSALKIRLTAPPVSGQANKHLLKYLANLFEVPQKQVELKKGHSSRTKTVQIYRPTALPSFITRSIST